jgi:hypothetical protein
MRGLDKIVPDLNLNLFAGGYGTPAKLVNKKGSGCRAMRPAFAKWA